MGRRIAIIFPGVGYHSDKPLLYYGKKLAKEHGYQIIEVQYGGFKSGMRGNLQMMQEAFESALRQAEEILKTQEFSMEDDILAISKSIGTVVAAAWQRERGITAKNIYFTPVEATFRYVREGGGIVFHGTADPWVATERIESGCRELHLPLHCYAKANHSMETGDTMADIKELVQIMQICEEYVVH